MRPNLEERRKAYEAEFQARPILDRLDHVVSFNVSKNLRKCEVIEECDRYKSAILDKEELQRLASELIALADTMLLRGD
jgi:hypothetical protein